eukprot:1977162-Amphidinium_carterae.1
MAGWNSVRCPIWRRILPVKSLRNFHPQSSLTIVDFKGAQPSCWFVPEFVWWSRLKQICIPNVQRFEEQGESTAAGWLRQS